MRRGLAPAALAALLAACGTRTAEAPPPEQTLEDFAMTRRERGLASWTLQARRAVLREDLKKVNLSEPRMELIEKGRTALRARSRRGTAHMETHDVVMSGAARLYFVEEDSTLETEELEFSSQSRQFRTDKPVVLRRPGAVVRGKGCVAGSDLSEVRIFHQESVIAPGSSVKPDGKTKPGGKAGR